MGNCGTSNEHKKLYPALNSQEYPLLDDFEMWAFRRLLKIPWMDRVTTDAVLKTRKTFGVLFKIRKRKLKFLGYIICISRYELF